MRRTGALVPLALSLLLCAPATEPPAAEWSPVKGHILTPWAGDVSPDDPWPEHPRPQLVRPRWTNLNGLWDYAILPRDAAGPTDGGSPESWDGKILVPFCIESALSGVKKPVGPENRLWYHRTFATPELEAGGRLLLHFGAVDWEATVYLNGAKVGGHRGGYDPWTVDVTDALRKDGKPNVLVLDVWDPTDAGYQPRGKQVRDPKGIWYTAVTGIWQTVWLEPVPADRIEALRITPDVEEKAVRVEIRARAGRGTTTFRVLVEDAGVPVASGSVSIGESQGQGGSDGESVGAGAGPGGSREIAPTIALAIPNPLLWSPDSPHLYDLKVSLERDGKRADHVESYFGLRKIEVRKDEAGILRLFLNGRPLFQYGPLDQGWWPDGLYTAPTDRALRYDIEVTKRLGMNMARKHVKIEPARWYAWCDRLGLLVWQDMPSGDRYIGGNQPDIVRSAESAENFVRELRAMVDAFYNHPSIVMWVPFNEGWGQWETAKVVDMVREWDPTRLVNSASGWTDRGVGDVHDIHSYPGPAMPPLEEKRAAVLGEFGGLGLPVAGRTWQDEKNWGYRSYTSREDLTGAYLVLLEKLRPLIGRGLSAAVYTQTTDVEIEVNGLLTYDRGMIKMDAEAIAAAARRLYLPPPIVRTVVPTAREEAATWRYTFQRPAEGWFLPEFDDASWKTGKGGFGTASTPGAIVGTVWDGSEIWIRRTFELEEVASGLQLALHHDEDAEVYLNGKLAAKLTGFVGEYIAVSIAEDALAALKPGPNVLAVRCVQTRGGQYIDAGLVQVVECGR